MSEDGIVIDLSAERKRREAAELQESPTLDERVDRLVMLTEEAVLVRRYGESAFAAGVKDFERSAEWAESGDPLVQALAVELVKHPLEDFVRWAAERELKLEPAPATARVKMVKSKGVPWGWVLGAAAAGFGVYYGVRAIHRAADRSRAERFAASNAMAMMPAPTQVTEQHMHVTEEHDHHHHHHHTENVIKRDVVERVIEKAVPGPPGPRGRTGRTGARGPRGKSIKGKTGKTGKRGVPGKAGCDGSSRVPKSTVDLSW